MAKKVETIAAFLEVDNKKLRSGLRRAKNDLRRVDRSTKRASGRASGGGTSRGVAGKAGGMAFSSKLAIGAAAIAGAAAALYKAATYFKGVIDKVVAFEERVINLTTSLGLDPSKSDDLSKNIITLSNKFGIKKEDVLSLFEGISRHTGNIEDTKVWGPLIAKLSRGTGINIAEMTNLVMELKASGLTVDQALKTVTNMFAQGRRGSFSLEAAANVGVEVMAMMKSMGVAGEKVGTQFMGLAQTIHKVTQNSHKTATVMRSILSTLDDPSKRKQLKSLGLDPTEFKKRYGSNWIQEWTKHASKVLVSDRGDELKQLFTIQGKLGLAALQNEGRLPLNKKTDYYRGAGPGDVDLGKQAGKVLDTNVGKIIKERNEIANRQYEANKKMVDGWGVKFYEVLNRIDAALGGHGGTLLTISGTLGVVAAGIIALKAALVASGIIKAAPAAAATGGILKGLGLAGLLKGGVGAVIGSALGYFHGEWMKGIVDKKRKEKKMDQRIKDRKKRGEPSLMDQYLYKYGMKQKGGPSGDYNPKDEFFNTNKTVKNCQLESITKELKKSNKHLEELKKKTPIDNEIIGRNWNRSNFNKD